MQVNHQFWVIQASHSFQSRKPNSPPLECGLDLVTCPKDKECGSRDTVWVLRLHFKKDDSVCPSASWVTLDEASGHGVRSFKQPYREICPRKNWDPLPTASTTCQSCGWATQEVDLVAPVKPSDDSRPQQSSLTVKRSREASCLSCVLSESLVLRNYERWQMIIVIFSH